MLTLKNYFCMAFNIHQLSKIMGVYQTSLPDGEVVDVPALSYIDFMPKCLDEGNISEKKLPKFDTYSSILEGVNRWLQDHPGLEVLKCESIEHKISQDKDGNMIYHLSEMLIQEASNEGILYVKGIRLWLVKNTHSSSAVQQLGVKNIVPADVMIEMPTHGLYKSGRIVISHEVRMMGGIHQFHTYEGLEDTMLRLKAQLRDSPLPGKILTIETDHIKTRQRQKLGLNAESTCWLDEKDKWFRSTQVIRVFYVIGPQPEEDVGYMEFVPEVIEQADESNPGKFELFNSLVDRIGLWASKHQDVKIVNLQHYDATVHHSHVGTSLDISSDSTDHVIDTHSERRLARTLRIFYVTSPVSLSDVKTLRCHLFLPPRTGHRSFESMTETMERVNAWLRITGLRVFTVETVPILFHEYNIPSTDYTLSEYTVHAENGRHCLTGIRLYFTSEFEEPDPSLLPPVPEYHHGLHGPEHCLLL